MKRLFALFLLCTALVRGEEWFNLVSYPRSANTWTRYFVECVLKCPTYGIGGGFYKGKIPYGNIKELEERIDRPFNFPLDKTFHFGLDEKRPVFLKIHRLDTIKNIQGPLILIIRDFKECIPSQILRSNKKTDYSYVLKEIKTHNAYYFTNLNFFHAYKGKKLLIYYEDLVKDPKTNFQKIIDFCQIQPVDFDKFIENMAQHRDKALTWYEDTGHFTPVTKGEKLGHFQEKLSPEDRKKLNQYVQRTYPAISKAYLQRYL